MWDSFRPRIACNKFRIFIMYERNLNHYIYKFRSYNCVRNISQWQQNHVMKQFVDSKSNFTFEENFSSFIFNHNQIWLAEWKSSNLREHSANIYELFQNLQRELKRLGAPHGNCTDGKDFEAKYSMKYTMKVRQHYRTILLRKKIIITLIVNKSWCF